MVLRKGSQKIIPLGPLLAELDELNVLGCLSGALLRITGLAHGLVIPNAVFSALTARLDVIPVHQNEISLG